MARRLASALLGVAIGAIQLTDRLVVVRSVHDERRARSAAYPRP